MRYMGVNELREAFLSFFETKDHYRLKSFSLVPQNDKSLLLINSGMAPLKPYFKGVEKPPSNRMVTCQKCIRTGDIENIGKTDRHGTFFEMLGNFSFGDYFKKESLEWSWEFLTKVLELPAERLYATVYLEDDEAFEIWENVIGLPKEKIFRLGKEDNFWEHGIGPCGPCSEIFFDRGEEYACGKEGCTVGCDCDRYIEIWNNVFTQFDAKEDGSYEELSYKNIDTGMGLERISLVMQNASSIFDIDTNKAVIEEVSKIAGYKYKENDQKDVSVKVIADHIKSAVFMTSDGVQFSNEGRGYVLRRLLRRAKRHGMLLGINREFLSEVADVVIKCSEDAYEELTEKREYILKAIEVEEERFGRTIKDGIDRLEELIKELNESGKSCLSGKDAFKLYDTYGFPFELTVEVLDDKGLSVDEEGFRDEMKKQKETAKAARKADSFMGRELAVYDSMTNVKSEFVGYDKIEADYKIISIVKNGEAVSEANLGDEVEIMTESTPFYPNGGGQHGDMGKIFGSSQEVDIFSTVRFGEDKIIHKGKVVKGNISKNEEVRLIVDENNRRLTARNHTATHLLQKALRNQLGDHIEQAGSDVNADRLRFDFTHFESISSDDLLQIEKEVNSMISRNMKVDICEMGIKEAKEKGAMALFGEKYKDNVRVVDISGYSIELCGGTHVKQTGEIGLIKIMSEGSVSSGVRRIEAITSLSAIEYFNSLENIISNIMQNMKAKTKSEIVSKISEQVEKIKGLEQEIKNIKKSSSSSGIDNIIESSEMVGSYRVVRNVFKDTEISEVIDIADSIKEKLKSCVVIFGIDNGEVASLMVSATDDLVKSGVNAGNIIKEIAPIIDGRGGGRPNMAQAGGKNSENITKALDKAINLLLN